MNFQYNAIHCTSSIISNALPIMHNFYLSFWSLQRRIPVFFMILQLPYQVTSRPNSHPIANVASSYGTLGIPTSPLITHNVYYYAMWAHNPQNQMHTQLQTSNNYTNNSHIAESKFPCDLNCSDTIKCNAPSADTDR